MASISICHVDWGNELLNNLQPLWKDETLCDTTIECKHKQIIPAHSILLAAASSKLHSYFSMVDQGSYTLVTHDVPVSVWRNILSFIYNGQLEVSEDELVPTYNFARKIEMNQFSTRLGEEIKQRGLCMEQQEAFLRTCRSSPRGQVMSPKSPRPTTASPRSSVASPLGPQGQIVSSQGQLVSTPNPMTPHQSPLAAALGHIAKPQTIQAAQSIGASPQGTLASTFMATSHGQATTGQGQVPMVRDPMMVYQRQGSSPRGSVATSPAAIPKSSLSSTVPTSSPITSLPSTLSQPPLSTNQHQPTQKPSQPPPVVTSVQPETMQPAAAGQSQATMAPPISASATKRKHSSDGGTGSSRYECPMCLKSFNREAVLRKHETECKVVTQAQSSVVSYKNFYTKILSKEGGDETTFKCDLCERAFGTYQGLYNHLRTKHQNQVQAVTQPTTRHFKPGELIGKSPSSASNARGRGSQLLNKSASCPICKKQFKTYASMLAHKSDVHKKDTSGSARRPSSGSGEVASETAATKSETAKAIPEVGESKMEVDASVVTPPPEFTCSECGRGFKKKMHLANHMNTHK